MATAITLTIPHETPDVYSGHLRLGGTNPQGRRIAFTNYYMLENELPRIPVMGEFHFSRYAHRFWSDELAKMKAGGIDIVATYVFWIHVEEDEGVFDWSGNNNLRRFVELCGKHGLDALVRLGPFAHGECRNGGLPDWLYGRPFEVRSNDERYLAYVMRLYEQIARQLDGLLFKNGGPVIGVQLDNEYMHCGAPWETTFKQGTEWVPAGSEGEAHILKLKQIARDAGLDVPIYTCTGWLRSPIPDGEVLPMQGGYAFTPWSPDPAYVQPPTREFLFRNRHLAPVLNGSPTYDAERYPYACCEIGGGIQDTYYHRNNVPPEAVEGLALVNLACGANLIGYYMYHGGSNPRGKHSYLNEFTVPRISYDFQAPLREYGQVADSFRSLRLYHHFLKDFGRLLAPMRVVLPDNAADITPDDTTTLRLCARAKGGVGFLFLNNYQDHVEMQDIADVRIHLQTPERALTIPTLQTLTLEKNVCAILPFGLTLDGVQVLYATAQLMTRIDAPDAVTYVFFVPRGMVSEYAFDTVSYTALSVVGGDTVVRDGVTYITVEPGLNAIIEMTSGEGKRVRFLTLTREQAEQATKLQIDGRKYLTLSNTTLVTDAGQVYAYPVGQDAISVAIYPPFVSLTSPFDIRETARGGLFTHYTVSMPALEFDVPVTHIAPDRALVYLPSALPDGVDNLYLRVAYRGDIGSGYMDGVLVADQFYNGSVWEIGLKHLLERGTGDELLILITPIRTSSGGHSFVPTGMAFSVAQGESFAVIDSITCVAGYRVPLGFGGG